MLQKSNVMLWIIVLRNRVADQQAGHYHVLRFDVSRAGFTDSKSELSEAVEENIGIRGSVLPSFL
jgi:hypothetical protein